MIRFFVGHALATITILVTSSTGKAYDSHSIDGSIFDVNSRQWREKVAIELFQGIKKQEKDTLFRIQVNTQQICIKTLTELEIFHGKLKKLQLGIQLVDQKNLVKTWKNREVLCDGKELSYFPSVMYYIAGTKYGKPFVKVFVKYEDKEEQSFIQTHSFPLQDTEFEFVINSGKNTKTKELKEIREREKKVPVLPDEIRFQLNEIINSQAETMYANYSTLTGLSVSTVRYEQGTLINDPCIVLYCLDKNLVPYGEIQLPTSIGRYPCDIRKGTFTLGSCADCRHANPGPGCSIGMPDDSYTGSAGFMVKSTVLPNKTGFLTAAHVSIEELLDLYDEGLFLSKCDFMDITTHEIVHPSYSDINENNRIGNVKESFIGDYGDGMEKTGIDVALVQSYTERLGDTNEMEVAQDKSLNWDGTTRVMKKGQSTGETSGILVHNSFSFSCKFERFPKSSFYFNNCYAIQDLDEKPFFESGDSGSGVFVTKNGRKSNPLGIAFARKDDGDITLVCRINPIIKECKLTIYEEEEQMEIEN